MFDRIRWSSLSRGFLLGVVFSATPGFHVAQADDWPQWLGPQRDAVWRETGILKKFPEGGPKTLWRTPIGGGYAGPAVKDGRVYVMDRQLPEEKPAQRRRGSIPGSERVICIDAKTGDIVWKHDYDCPYVNISYPTGPRTTPYVDNGRVYTLGTMGHMCCLEAETGNVIWEKNLPNAYETRPPVWGYSSHLLIDGDRLYSLVGGEGSCVVAFHKDTGEELWRAMTTREVGYAPPMIFEAGGKRQLIIWDSDAVNSLNPETGEIYWQELHPADGKPRRPAVTISTPMRMGNLLLVTTAYHGSLALELAGDKPAVKAVWRSNSTDPMKPDGLHAVMATPIFVDGHIYGIGGTGELMCVDTKTGKPLWQTYAVTTGDEGAFCANAFLVRNGDHFFIPNETGELIIAKLTPKGYEEIDRAKLLEPTQPVRGRQVVWSHPAFANRCIYLRNDMEIVCVSLAEGQ